MNDILQAESDAYAEATSGENSTELRLGATRILSGVICYQFGQWVLTPTGKKENENTTDEESARKLLHKVVLNYKDYQVLIQKYSKNWDFERIAFIDILLMQMAISEGIEFPSIPIKVTLNEYLELAKYYSTAKSSIFINGILDKIFAYLKENNQIKKQGRGLIGEL